MRQAHGHQVGPHGGVPRLLRLPRLPQHHELPARGGEDRPGEGGGGPGRREVPGVRRRHGDEARPLRTLPGLHPLPRVQGDAPGVDRGRLPQGLRRPDHRA
ncbi:MAG TPA: hypothetical protein VFF02_19910, partial [Anaeromyxobacteraceae bacterium]|nr:hypothetical protein [Anaeromyxobacteraceae bacterium]